MIEDARKELRGLGIRTPPATVKSVVQRIRNGESIYQISEGDLSVVAKKTANKIKALLEAGNLGFLWEVQPEIEAFHAATVEIEATADLPRYPVYPGSTETELPWNRLQRFIDEEGIIGEVTVESLEHLGIPTQESLDILDSWDGFLGKLATEYGTVADLQKIIYTHQYVRLHRLRSVSAYKAPRGLLAHVAAAFAKGWVDGNIHLRKLAWDVFAYQIWRGPEFLAAFKRSQVRSRRVERYYLRLFEEALESGESVEATNG